MPSSTKQEEVYHPQDAIAATVKTTLISGAVGLFASSVQNTLQKRNYGPWGVFTRTGGTIALFASVGGAYEFARTAAANLREKEDHWNAAWGGFFGGAAIGLRARTFPAVLGYGVAVATVLSVFEYTGGSLAGKGHANEEDEFARRERLRKNYRSPIEETVAQLGEGRGIHGVNYEERRRQRIKEHYGIDVPAAPQPAGP
ncbi:uncharacterized protein PADG_04937 [Paracoccidioides brasiliensis Pb18]|uniref:NADH-ubiquinone oxidoreductase 213 kDa subunit n=2 Tax=Paracoccidioides brasiliensis TaxID=121759 RepID=C1GBD6_PARBD|nr:uncharacterized protein PADG_04937 [Paracoccidioides brasiliensis Pb18]EEH48858.1 hypothetical protein PADG_04937 [Paracoccidioides brasiliensis Pb18]ODH14236.1 hypothetical protein ACO22_06634 [Paracoccidioides brasiliensis]ODH51397.1 hypothetical protein GX48_02453 [Paracoccidioides brasiliensis]